MDSHFMVSIFYFKLMCKMLYWEQVSDSDSDEAYHSAHGTFAVFHPDFLALNHEREKPACIGFIEFCPPERAVFSVPADLHGLCFLKSSSLLT